MQYRANRGKLLLAVLILAVAVSMLVLGGSGALAAVSTDGDEHTEETFDARDRARAVSPTQDQIRASERLQQEAGSGTSVSWDERVGTPRKAFKSGGYLSGPESGSAVEVARGWLLDNREMFGLSRTAIEDAEVARNHEMPGTGTRQISLQQSFGELEGAFGGRMNVAVTEEGRVLSYAGDPTPAGTAGGGYSLSASDAVSTVASDLAPGQSFTPEATNTEEGWQVFERGQFADVQRVKKVAFPTAEGARSAYRVLFVEEMDEAYDVIVDAESGEVLYRASLVDHQVGDSEGTVYENYPGAQSGGEPVIKSFEGDPEASPSGWVDPSGLAGLDGPTTFGNNANSYANWSNFLVPADGAPRPVSATSKFNYAFGDQWRRSNGETEPPSYAEDLDPATTNLFYHHNRIHDEYYDLGFTESAGNFQVNNNGEGGAGGDPVLGLVQAGAATGGEPAYTGRDNAYMLTLPDGLASWSGMFLWEPIPAAFEAPYVDGDMDAGVIQHEYTHGLTNRYVAGGDALGSSQSGAMGEGWSDWYALNYLDREGFLENPAVGEYVTGNEERAIRNWAADENPLGYGDIGYDITGPGVHADGEIWNSTLWDLRETLIARYGEQRGAEVATRLVTDAMPLSAPDPSYLDMRDAILTADVDRYHGDNFDDIWTTFSKRGMGDSAETDTGDDERPEPAFDHLDDSRNGRLAGKVVNAATGNEVEDARVIVGEYEARVSEVANTNANGGFALSMTSGKYPITVQAPGYGSKTVTAEVEAGDTERLKVSIAPNLASESNGGRVVSASSQDADKPAEDLIDDTEASAWSTEEGDGNFDGEHAVVELAERADISSVQLSAFIEPGDSRFSAMQDWTLQTSTDGDVWETVDNGTFETDDPRPATPELHYERARLDEPTDARYVRFFIDSAQDDSVGYAEAAELQVFAGKQAKVEPR